MSLNFLSPCKASREVANLTYTRIWFQRICLSVCLSVHLSVCNKFWPQLSQDWAEIFWGMSTSTTLLTTSHIPNIYVFSAGAGMAWAEGRKANLLSKYIYFIPHQTKNNNLIKKVCNFGCQICFCKLVFASKTANLWLNWLFGRK